MKLQNTVKCSAAVLSMCLLLPGCGTAAPAAEEASPAETTETAPTLPAFVSTEEKTSGTYDGNIEKLFFDLGTPAETLSDIIPDFCIVPSGDGTYTAAVPVKWGGNNFDVTMLFDEEYRFGAWSAENSDLTVTQMTNLLGDYTAWYGLGMINSYSYEWETANDMYFYLNNGGYLRYGPTKNITKQTVLDEDNGAIFSIRCGMTREEVVALIGEPSSESKNGASTKCEWFLDSLASVQAQGASSAYSADLNPAQLICDFRSGQLFETTYYLFGLSSADAVTAELYNRFAPYSEDISELRGMYTLREIESLNGDLILYPNAAGVYSIYSISWSNYEYYDKASSAVKEDTSDGKIGDNDGNGVIDEKDWETEWKDYLSKKLG